MYMKHGQEVPCPDRAAGLYVRDQHGRVVQVRVPADHIAFQMGEAMQACTPPASLHMHSLQRRLLSPACSVSSCLRGDIEACKRQKGTPACPAHGLVEAVLSLSHDTIWHAAIKSCASPLSANAEALPS